MEKQIVAFSAMPDYIKKKYGYMGVSEVIFEGYCLGDKKEYAILVPEEYRNNYNGSRKVLFIV